MNKKFLLTIALFCVFLVSKASVYGISLGDEITNIVNDSVKSISVTYSDLGYTNSTNRFQAGDTIFIKIDTNSQGTKNRIIRILDSDKKIVKEVPVNIVKNENNILYAGSITLNSSGIYYLDIKIEDDESSYSMQQNIEIVGAKSDDQESDVKTPDDKIEKDLQEISRIPTVSEENKFKASSSSFSQIPKIETRSFSEAIKNFFNQIINLVSEKLKNNPLTRK